MKSLVSIQNVVSTAVSLFLGLMIGNFGWQAFTSNPDWGVAAERSFFQFLAMAIFVALLYFNNRKSPDTL